MKILSTNRYTNPPAQPFTHTSAIKRNAKVYIIFYTAKYFWLFFSISIFTVLFLVPFEGVHYGLYLPEILTLIILRRINETVEDYYILAVAAIE